MVDFLSSLVSWVGSLMDIKQFASAAIDVPFKDKGRDYQGWDCYGLMRCFLNDVHGIQIPSFSEEYENAGMTKDSRDHLEVVIKRKKEFLPQWVKVEEPREGDGVLFLVGGRPIHMGLMIDRFKFLHTEFKINTVIESINSMAWSKRVEGFYRYV